MPHHELKIDFSPADWFKYRVVKDGVELPLAPGEIHEYRSGDTLVFTSEFGPFAVTLYRLTEDLFIKPFTQEEFDNFVGAFGPGRTFVGKKPEDNQPWSTEKLTVRPGPNVPAGTPLDRYLFRVEFQVGDPRPRDYSHFGQWRKT